MAERCNGCREWAKALISYAGARVSAEVILRFDEEDCMESLREELERRLHDIDEKLKGLKLRLESGNLPP